ncbi:hypothetical protein ACP70R_045098 [Stipagrostis hirtigluma subsp. patula]
MKSHREPSGSCFGPQLRLSFRQNMVNGSPLRRPRKPKSRFGSRRMKIILEEVMKRQENMRFVMESTRNMMDQQRNLISQQARQNLRSGSNGGWPSAIAMKENLIPLGTSASKATNSPLSSMHNTNVSTLPLDPSHISKMKQGLVHNTKNTERPSSQSYHLKAMPGLVHNAKRQLAHDQGQARWMHDTNRTSGCISNTNDDISKRRSEPLSKENITRETMTKKRRFKYTNGNQEDDTTKSTSQLAFLKDYRVGVPTPVVSDCAKPQCQCCSKPIDEPTWSGILKIGSKEYISLAAHLSTKSGTRVWNLSKSLTKVVEVTKVCTSEVWPKRWETSRPGGDNIGLYFLPHKNKMRLDQDLDQLVKEIMENDLALQAVIDEAEMLIFPSSLLPKRYQTFQTKHYLWGVFKPREVEAANNMALESATDEELKRRNVLRHTKRTAEATAVAAKAAAAEANGAAGSTAATQATSIGAPAVPANRGQTDSSMGVPPGRMVSLVVRQTPRVEQLIQEMEREGALVVAVQGETIGSGSCVANSAMRYGRNGA